MKNEPVEFIEQSKLAVHGENRILYFFDEVNNVTVLEAIKILDAFESKSKKPIYIILNSVGGNEYDGLLFYDRIRNCKSKVTILGSGLVASMALIIYVAGDKRICTKYTRFLNHQGATEIRGRVSDIEIERKELIKVEEICNTILAERTNQDVKKLTKSIKDGNNYMSAEQALKMGFVHEII